MKLKISILSLVIAVLCPLLTPQFSVAHAQESKPAIADKLPKVLPARYRQIPDLDMLLAIAPDTISLGNNYGGESHIVSMTDDYAEIQVTDSSTLQVRELKDKKGQSLYLCVYTFFGEAPDSEALMVTQEGTELPLDKYVKMPRTADFFFIPKGCVTTKKELEEMLPFRTTQIKIDSGAQPGITFSMDPQDYMSTDDWQIMQMFLQPLHYTWENGKFIPSRNQKNQ